MFGKFFAVALILATTTSLAPASECQVIGILDDDAGRSVPPLTRGKVASTEASRLNGDRLQQGITVQGKPDIATEMRLRGRTYLICPEYPD